MGVDRRIEPLGWNQCIFDVVIEGALPNVIVLRPRQIRLVPHPFRLQLTMPGIVSPVHNNDQVQIVLEIAITQQLLEVRHDESLAEWIRR